MNYKSIREDILKWYDSQKRDMPWRGVQDPYKIWVSEIMLQQTQVETVKAYYNKWIKRFPDIKSVAKATLDDILKHWEGLGYYSRARNFHESCKKIYNSTNTIPSDYDDFINLKGNLPSSIEELKKLPGIGDYTSQAISAIAFNKAIIPLDGNVERVLKRVLYLKKEKEITKENLNYEKSFFGTSKRCSDYAQAIMEIGALICKPSNPVCLKCPISDYCVSFKKNDFQIKSKNKFHKVKYFEAKIYKNKDKYLLIKNNKFNFLRNLPIFPMKEVKKDKFKSSLNSKININMSNMKMKIILNKKDKLPKIKNSFVLNKNNFQTIILPSFTKKIFKSISRY